MDPEEKGTSFSYYGTQFATTSITNDWNIVSPHVQISGGSQRVAETTVPPRLYFKYLKSKLSLIENRNFKKRMDKLEELADKFMKTGQEAMSDGAVRQFLVLSREAAIYACGFKKFLTQEHVSKYQYKLKGATLKQTPLKNFARVLPKSVAKIIKNCIEKKLFDDYVVFHLDNKGQVETEKEKIERKRDPILFGKLEGSDKLYLIVDWEDELDDLRLSDIVEKLVLKGEEITLPTQIIWTSSTTVPATDGNA